VWGADINPRAIRFAAFNQKLNGIEGASLYCGDLFEPVRSKVFDRIVAHPPYVPMLADKVVFRDGGVDGERVSMEVIRQLPRHLADGGEFYGYLMLSNRVEAAAELRVREMLGVDGREFDVALLVDKEWPMLTYLSDRAGSTRLSQDNERMIENCRKLGIRKFVVTALSIRSRRSSSPSTIRQRAVTWQTMKATANRPKGGL
jgi:methylase of polypeptide subunit release factors